MQMVGNLVIFGITILHFLIIVWNRQFFHLFGGDAFTYGMVTLGINLSTFVWTFAAGMIILYRYGHNISTFQDVPYFIWGLLSLGLIGSLLIQMFSIRSVAPLPERDERRNYETPRSD